ncbi:hypothetical protein FISHEDRAFT_49327 [Fistulina hepatica ATCC 64428]|uniref:Copper acquisition factor BIM1-like domain-containing protein n=1 Tax=Fistulina hepatica ATCC 64428 TaxID=1128425 RepID=A0A0D7A3P6_9AGAR|nr:hypothetical protein FISHEDRAFT_49327 [Fistulina hepatica ATCC 64428]
MRVSTFLFTALALVGAVQAHFQLQFPTPRGVFNMDNEVDFCDGYDTPATNRTTFPLSGGFFSLNSEHESWTAGVFVSAAADPTSFDNFTQVKSFFSETGEGLYCFPLNLSNDTALTNGTNVTIQIEYNGGDGNLFQCADLTLSDDYTISSSVSCTNASSSSSSTSSSSTTSATSSSSSADVVDVAAPRLLLALVAGLSFVFL